MGLVAFIPTATLAAEKEDASVGKCLLHFLTKGSIILFRHARHIRPSGDAFLFALLGNFSIPLLFLVIVFFRNGRSTNLLIEGNALLAGLPFFAGLPGLVICS